MTDFVSSISNGLETMYNASTKSKKVFAIIILILLIYPTLELGVDSVTQQPPPPAPDQALPPAPLMKPVKVFLLITGQTYQAHQQILDKLNAQGSKVMITDAQQCDLILLFCPILSRVRSDVEAAFRKIPEDAQGKQVVLVQMHHTRKPEQVLNQIQWKEQFPIIIQDVQVLYHETQNGLLQCPRNERALHALQSMFAEFENKMATQRFFGKRSREKSSDLNTDPVPKLLKEKSEDPVYQELGVDSVTQLPPPPPPAPDQALPPAPVMKPVKVFLLITGQTYQAHQQILDKLNAQGSKVMITDAQQCDLILLFCPILSRVRSNVEAAFRKIPEDAQGKQVVLVQMHHTRKPEQVLNQIQWKEQFPIIIQDVQVLYHETQNGLLQCPRNERALHALQSMFVEFKNKMATQRFFGKRSREKSSDFNTGPVSKFPKKKSEDSVYKELGVDSVTQLPPPPPPAPDQALPPAPVMKPVKVFLLITGQTYQAHQQILDKLNAQGSKVMITDAQQCDLILLFCPILSRVRSDVEAAFRKIPEDAQGKQVVLVQMHHTRKPEQVLNQIQWKEQFPIIIQDVQVLYHETQNGLLQCPRNERALHALQRMFVEFKNQMATQRFFGKRSREKSSDLNTGPVSKFPKKKSEDSVYKELGVDSVTEQPPPPAPAQVLVTDPGSGPVEQIKCSYKTQGNEERGNSEVCSSPHVCHIF
ncbi:uncharacterized protein LOC117381165 isoform X7 [Periophthalmus magnuspinnatus]|uniref:uncharacterized protein LOC117381165 isoform X7 n=1 Tax=Periophthalmus magnuspinnatus TaxID=409849 RepID=UPI0024366ABA|nr:uncharacterized protein LOC117381165 isoform X7 [Periophthalmus magnuspinnatus]